MRLQPLLCHISRSPLHGIGGESSYSWQFPVLPLHFPCSLFFSVGAVVSIALPGLFAFIVSAYYVYGYLRFSLKGPSFILDSDGIEFAGHRLRWRDVSAIDYSPSGRTPTIRIRNTDPRATGFSMFDQFCGKTSVSAYLIADPDSLVGWSRRLKEEDSRTSPAHR